MKILQVISLFSHGEGGCVAVTYELSRALAQNGHEVVIYTSDFELDQDYINSLRGVKVYPFHSMLNLVTLHITPSLVTEAKRKLKDFDIIHMQAHNTFQNVVVHYYAKKYGIPYVVDAHGLTIGLGSVGKKIFKWLFDVTFGYSIIKDASRVIAETELGVSEYKKVGVNQDKIVLIYPLPDFGELSQLPPSNVFRSEYNIKEKYIILFLGRIDWVKGLDFLVESFHKLVQYRNDVILVIVGSDWGYKTTLENLIHRLKISDKVLFTGFLSGQEKLSALVDATVMVQPSRYEQGLSWSSLEAILCNTPIIVTKNTGAGEDVSRIDAGYLVEFGNKKELVDTIQKILNSPSEAVSKTQKAKEYIISNLSLEKNIEKYEKVYMDCITDKQVKG